MNWRKVWTVARHEYMMNVRRPGFIIVTLLVPLIMFVIVALTSVSTQAIAHKFASLFGSMEKPYAVVDEAGIIERILPEFQKDFVLYPSMEEAKAAADRRKVMAVIRIPPDYVETGKIYAYSPVGNVILSTLEDSTRVRAFLSTHLVAQHVPPDLLPRVEKPIVQVIPITGKTLPGSPLASVGRIAISYALGMLLIFSIFMSSGYVLQGVAEEKENRLVEIILSSLKTMEWFLGKVVGLGAVGLTQVAIWFLTVLLLSGGGLLALVIFLPPFPWSFYLLIALYYVGGYFLYATLYAGLAALGTNMRESQQISGVVSLVAAIPFMLSGILFTSPDSVILRAVSIFPLTAPGMMLLRLPISEPPTIDIVLSLLSVYASIPLALWFGAKLFRFGILIYGQRPGLRQIWQALRSA